MAQHSNCVMLCRIYENTRDATEPPKSAAWSWRTLTVLWTKRDTRLDEIENLNESFANKKLTGSSKAMAFLQCGYYYRGHPDKVNQSQSRTETIDFNIFNFSQ